MAACRKEYSEFESVRKMEKLQSEGVVIYKTDYLKIHLDANVYTRARNITAVSQPIVKMIEDGVQNIVSQGKTRFFVLFQTLWNDKSDKHSTTMEVEYDEDTNTLDLYYFDSNGKLVIGVKTGKKYEDGKIHPKFTQDYNICAVLTKIVELLREKGFNVTHKQLIEENINDMPGGGICDAFAILYVIQSAKHGREEALEVFDYLGELSPTDREVLVLKSLRKA